MTCATASYYGKYIVSVELSGNAINSEEDAERAAAAVSRWLETQPHVIDLAAMREEFRLASEGGIEEANAENTAYGRLTAAASVVAERAAIEGWKNPWADVIAFVDIEP